MQDVLANAGLILSSSIFAALITHLFSRYNNDKNIVTEHVTKERKIWRDKIRDIAVEVNQSYQEKNSKNLSIIEVQLYTLLNPYDKNDKKIISIIKTMQVKQESGALAYFNISISRLLKHDWDRVKKETSFFISSRGLFLALVTLSLTAPIAIFLFNLLDQKYQINSYYSVILFSIYFSGLPVLYHSTLGFLSSLISSKCKRTQQVLCWLKNEPYREYLGGLEKNYNVRVKNENENESKSYSVSISESVS